MLNKLTVELDDDQLTELRQLIQKLERIPGSESVTIKMNGILKGALKEISRQLIHFDDFKKRDLW